MISNLKANLKKSSRSFHNMSFSLQTKNMQIIWLINLVKIDFNKVMILLNLISIDSRKLINSNSITLKMIMTLMNMTRICKMTYGMQASKMIKWEIHFVIMFTDAFAGRTKTNEIVHNIDIWLYKTFLKKSINIHFIYFYIIIKNKKFKSYINKIYFP